MLEEPEFESNENNNETTFDFLGMARLFEESNSGLVAVYMYLAAFEVSSRTNEEPSEEIILGLKSAWYIACSLRNRSLAEVIFDCMEPYLDSEELDACALSLQDLAMDRLEEFGVSRGELQGIMESLPRELFGGGEVPPFHIDQITGPMPFFPFGPQTNTPIDLSAFAFPAPEEVAAYANTDEGSEGRSCQCGGQGECQCEEEDGCQCGHYGCGCSENGDASKSALASSGQPPQSQNPALPFGGMIPPWFMGAAAPKQADPAEESDKVTYADLAGFEIAVNEMKSYGIGAQNDPEFREFINMLNEKHGLDGMPVLDTLLFRAPAREDAGRLMEATFGELNLPGVRMRIEENLQGVPVLCVLAQTGHGLKLNAARNEFRGAGVLILEDIDMWGHLIPSEEELEERQSKLTRGAKEALKLIRSAVENPEVYVLASCELGAEIDGFFLDILNPVSLIDIDYPTETERFSLWKSIIAEHPSIEDADVKSLVDYSIHLPRYDIYMAAREAVDATYKASLISRKYEPVTMAALCERLAAYQPLESSEYRSLEDAVIEDFRAELGDLDSIFDLGAIECVDDLLGGEPDDLESTQSSQE